MKHSEAIKYWENVANNDPNEKSVKVNPRNDYTDIDAEFIIQNTNNNSEVLDLGCGTGITLNKYYDNVKHVDAVELFPEFTKFIHESSKIDVYNQSITDFDSDKLYDTILMFGVVQYFNEEEIEELYEKYKKMLNESGSLIIKNQFGVDEDVTVSGVSEELQTSYESEYRHIDKELSILKKIGFTALNTIDIYPPYASRWDNTHFYAIVASES